MLLGFIGSGNMAGALISGIVGQNVTEAKNVAVFDVDQTKSRAFQESLGVIAYADCREMIEACDMVLLAVKPNVVEKVLTEYRLALRSKALLSIAAGWTVDMLNTLIHRDTRLLRIMPNTPALCGAGMTAFSRAHTLLPEEAAFAERAFSALGRLVWVEESQMEAVVGLSGSGPAYAYLFIEAMADGGVACGLPRAQALEMAAQTLLGSAKMALETGRHPGVLKDAVCSPGGTTIAAVRSLERDGFRGAVIDAVIAARDKAMDMRK